MKHKIAAILFLSFVVAASCVKGEVPPPRTVQASALVEVEE
jgi:hypothetical protein